MVTILRAFTIAFMLQLYSLPVFATLVAYGFDAYEDGSCPPSVCTNEIDFGRHLVKATFIIDTNAQDLNPDPTLGWYSFSGGGTGLSIDLGGLTLFTNAFTVTVFNDIRGPYCGANAIRDLVQINSDLGGAVFDTCNTDAITSDTLLQDIDLAKLGPGHQCCGESFWVNTPPLLPTGLAQFLGNTLQIYRVPEPASLTLLSVGLLGIGVARRRKRSTSAC